MQGPSLSRETSSIALGKTDGSRTPGPSPSASMALRAFLGGSCGATGTAAALSQALYGGGAGER